MKNLSFMAIVAMFMMFSCTKDDLITTGQESISVGTNNKAVVSGELTSRGPIKDNNGIGTGLWLKGASSRNDSITILYSDSEPLPKMKILSHGNFSGKMIGYGKIDAVRSEYDIIKNGDPDTNLDFGTVDNCWGKFIYNLKIDGTIYLNDRDSSYFTFTISGKFHTNYNTLYYIGSSSWGDGLTGEITGGEGKFLNFKKLLNGIVSCDNLEEGAIYLRIY